MVVAFSPMLFETKILGNNQQPRGPSGQYATMPPQQQWQQQQQFQHRPNQGSPAVPPYGNQVIRF